MPKRIISVLSVIVLVSGLLIIEVSPIQAATLTNVTDNLDSQFVRQTTNQTIKFTTATGDLSAPASPPTLTVAGATGTTSWGYEITAFSANGETLLSDESVATTGTSTLSNFDYIKIDWTTVSGTSYYGVYRTTAGGTPTTTGRISTTTVLTLNDTGLTASGSPPTVNTTADIKYVRITFPAGFDVSGTGIGTYTAVDSEAGPTASSSGQVITVTFATTSVGTASKAFTLPLTNIINPSTCQYYTVNVETRGLLNATIDDPTDSDQFYVFCYTSPPPDTIAPTSAITFPTSDMSFKIGEKVSITGTAQDTGGSGIQQVELSFDDGKTWNIAYRKGYDEVYTWEYVWTPQVVATYTIKTRATDWAGNQEIVGPGVIVKIVEQLVEEKPPVEKPITEMTVEELKTKITEVQQKIIELLQQLIKLIQAQITELQAKSL